MSAINYRKDPDLGFREKGEGGKGKIFFLGGLAMISMTVTLISGPF